MEKVPIGIVARTVMLISGQLVHRALFLQFLIHLKCNANENVIMIFSFKCEQADITGRTCNASVLTSRRRL